MSVTLLALYHRPDGGAEALQTFRRRYRDEHLPLIRQVPGLRSVHVASIERRLMGEHDLVLIARMIFDDRVSLDAGLASEEMRAAGRNLREVAPEIVELFVAEPDAEMGATAADLPAEGGPDGGPDGSVDEAGPDR
jgi:uncharacterized protein (TIGR02118 family)